MTALEIVLEAAERRASEFLEQAYKYRNLGMPTIAEETEQRHLRPLVQAIRQLQAEAASTMYVTGLLDEHEFMQQMPPHGISVHGPFYILEQAQAHARTLSSDPDEAVVIPLTKPTS